MSDKSHLISKVTEAFYESRESMANRRDAFLRMWRNYKQVYESDDEAMFTNNVFSTMTLETVETFRPYLSQIPPDMTVLPKPGLPDVASLEAAKRVENWQRSQWYCQQMDKKRKSVSFFGLLYGMGIAYHFYRKEDRDLSRKVFNPDGTVTIKTEKSTVYDDPDIEVVDILNDFFPDPYGRSVEECNYIVYRRIIRKDEMIARSKGEDPWYTNTPAVDDLGALYDDYDDGASRNDLDRFGDAKEIQEIAKQNLVETLEYWEDDRLIIVANRSHVLRDSENPYWRAKKKPFSVFEDYDNPHEFWAVGEGEILLKPQHELNWLKRSRVDFTKRKLRPGFFTPTGSGVDMAGYYSEEGYTIETPMPDAIRPIQFPDAIEGLSFQAEQDLKLDGENATGATPLMKGNIQVGMNTATEGRIQQGNAMSRANYKADNMNEFLKSWMEWNVALAAQYYEAERLFRVKTEYGFEVHRLLYEDLVRGMDYEIASASSLPLTRDDKLMMADVMFSRFYQLPEIDKHQLLTVVMRLMDIPNRQGLLKPREVIMQEQAGAMAAAQQQQADLQNQELLRGIMDKGLFGGGEE